MAVALSFFAQQERARRASARLVLLYLLAVAAIVASVNLLLAPFYQLFYGPVPRSFHLWTSAAVLGVIALGSLEIVARLAQGRGQLASLLSGRQVLRGRASGDEQRLLNIVDEMSIASGLTAPPVYVLRRESGINAFAAGESPSRAIVVVTQGAVDELTRDELQAVIAHEFSHILNGDIRVNLRAVYVLQGITFLSGIGRFMMRYYSGFGTEDGKSLFHPVYALIGAGLYLVGGIGLVFARLIQAALARERENLADASAVQFTRNADALCGALARIKVHGEGSSIRNWHADALAHMLFAPGSRGWLAALLATHPPIEERLRRSNPHVAPEFYLKRARRPRAAIEQAERARAEAERDKAEAAARAPATIVPRRQTGVAALVASIGTADPSNLEYAEGLLAYLPASIREPLGDPQGAQAVMIAALLEAELEIRRRQLEAVEAELGEAPARRAEVIAPLVRQLDRAYRLPLVALAVPALKTLDEAARGRFLAALRGAIRADSRVTLSEFVLDTILDWTLGPRAARSGEVRHSAPAELAPECALVLSLLAHAGGGEARAAYDEAAAALGLPPAEPAAAGSLSLAAVAEALERLATLAPEAKAKLLEAGAGVAAHDGNVRLAELELLRAVACALDCPMPPALAALDPRLLRK